MFLEHVLDYIAEGGIGDDGNHKFLAGGAGIVRKTCDSWNFFKADLFIGF